MKDTTATESVASMAGSAVPADADFGGQFSKMVVDLVDALVLQLDLAGHIVACNPAVERRSGYALPELVGSLIESAFFPPDESDHLKEILSQLRGGERQLEWESDIETKQGQFRRIGWTFSLEVGARGTASSIVAVGTDITAEWNLLIAESRVEELKERRGQPRKEFRREQLISPLVEGKRMDQHCFFDVRCYDISTNGFSYTSRAVPQNRELVVGFGTPPSLTYVTAEIVRISPIVIDGEKTNLIGCRYTGRGEPDSCPESE